LIQLFFVRRIEFFILIFGLMVVMKNLMKLIAVALVGAMGVSCSTSYDSYGNRSQTVDPAGAAIGAVALGVIAYSVGRSSGKRSEHRRHTSGYNNDRYGNYGGRSCR